MAKNFFQKLNSGQLMKRKVNILGTSVLFTKFEECSWARKRSGTFLIFHSFSNETPLPAREYYKPITNTIFFPRTVSINREKI